MKKLSALLLLCAFSTTSYALTTDTLLLSANIGRKLSIAVTSETVASSLDLETSQSDLKVATINEKSNSKTGYKIKISSANLGNLKRAGGTDTFGYSLSYDSAAVDLTTAIGQTFSHTSGVVTNANRDVAISYTGVPAESLVEGAYSDTVTFTISAI